MWFKPRDLQNHSVGGQMTNQQIPVIFIYPNMFAS